jgi:hypothetical protein
LVRAKLLEESLEDFLRLGIFLVEVFRRAFQSETVGSSDLTTRKRQEIAAFRGGKLIAQGRL